MSESYRIKLIVSNATVLTLIFFSAWPMTHACGVSYNEKEANQNSDRTYRASWARSTDAGGGRPFERRSLRVGRRSPRFDTGGILEGSGPDVGEADANVCEDFIDFHGRDCAGEGVDGSDSGDDDKD